MGNLTVESVGINELLRRIRTNMWLVPTFQRDFVWSEADVTSLVLSILDARPIGMATLWAQPDDSGLELEPVSIQDSEGGETVTISLGPTDVRPNTFWAILDGRQRCTAIAMAFGGLRPASARRRFAGRWFLNVTATDDSERVIYLKEGEVKSRGLDALGHCIKVGLFPLAADGDDLLGQWVGYVQEIMNPVHYPNGQLPSDEQLQRRNDLLKAAFAGISQTLLAVYIVPDDYGLGEICEIFETLNTTGTRVSTVDLLHSWLYSDTVNDDTPVRLRDWIDELGQQNGAEGWASRSERPELIAQIATAAYVLIDSEKPEPRAVGRRKSAAVTSLKAGDLLATPAPFWREFVANSTHVASYLGGFQEAVGHASFPYKRCPYPVTIAIYAGLRWYMDHDTHYSGQWSVQELNALFGAFFWRNALGGRYDQGFLTQSAVDMKMLKELLFQRPQATSANDWATQAGTKLAQQGIRLPSLKDLENLLLDARPAGALGLALALPVWTRPTQDLLDPNDAVAYPSSKPVELHHLYPRDWCRNNRHGTLANILDPSKAAHDYVRSVANLTPLTRESNNVWKAQNPGQALAQAGLDFANSGARLESHFIDDVAYASLVADSPDPARFWNTRASLIAEELASRCEVSL